VFPQLRFDNFILALICVKSCANTDSNAKCLIQNVVMMN